MSGMLSFRNLVAYYTRKSMSSYVSLIFNINFHAEPFLRLASFIDSLHYTVSQKTSKIIFVITTSNFHQI